MEKRIETFFSLALPYRETLTLRRSVFQGEGGPRLAVVAGMYGDEVEGTYLCHRLAAWLEEPDCCRLPALSGRIELYPVLNPLGLDSLQRGLPGHDSDLDRNFPGHAEGLMAQRIAAALLAQLQGAALVIELQAGASHLREWPQVQFDRRFESTLAPLAASLRLPVIWMQNAARLAETTLAHTLNASGTPCLRIVLGAAMSLSPVPVDEVLQGIVSTCRSLGVLAPDPASPPPVPPLLTGDAGVQRVAAPASGLFVATAAVGQRLQAGDLLGRIVSPYAGPPLAEVRSPAGGLLLSLRHYPVVYESSVVARVVTMPGE